jgi:hypothetical protein
MRKSLFSLTFHLRDAFAGTLLFLLLGTPVQAAAQRGITFELRFGAVASTPLAVDSIVLQSTLDKIAGLRHTATLERARPGIAPVLQLAARTALRQTLLLEASGSWTLAQLHSSVRSGTVQSLGIATGMIGLNYQYRPLLHGRAGFGVIHYGATETGLFRQGTSLQPLVEVAIGTNRDVSGARLSAELLGQVHSFGSAALRAQGGTAGSVIRGGILFGVTPGGRR